ncbi:hypothetical protein C8Q80DRAFT_122280 [Daedaleopsis nitida]|nr:hypothetical protein C8Q80DRAFT_122280 [Daedaleopsis nitida]
MKSQLLDILAELDSRINHAAPINRLPPEILLGIFTLLVDELKDEVNIILPLDPSTRVDTESLVRLIHVCRYWRSVALNAPTLWTRCDNRDMNKLSTFFERSRDCPVSLLFGVGWIAFSGPSDSDEHRIRTCTTHTRIGNKLTLLQGSRLRRLDLEVTLTYENITPLSDLYAQYLECLTISMDEDRPQPHQNLWVPILAGHTDYLKALAIWPVKDWLPSNVFPNLTHLTLSFRISSATPRDLVVLLGRTPRLEFLFVDLLVHYQPVLPMPAHSIILDKMRSLVFSSCAYTLVMPIMKCLSLPSHSLVRLDELLIEAEIDGPAGPLPHLPVLQHACHMDIIADAYALLLAVDNVSCGCGFFLQTFYERPGTPDGWNLWLLDLPTAISLANITTLRLNIHPAHTFWPVLLQHMSEIVELSVVIGAPRADYPGSDPMRMFCDLLSQDSPVLCPSLCTLLVQGLRVDGANASTTLSYRPLASMLAARARTGHRISHFEVQLAPTVDEDSIGTPTGDTLESYAALGEHVDVFRLVPAGAPLCEFKVREVWADSDGMERYWRLDPDEEAPLGDRIMPEL